LDSFDIQNSEQCYECLESKNLYNCHYCRNCHDCNNCFACINLKNKSFCILNKQYTKIQYQEKIKNYEKDKILSEYNELSKIYPADNKQINSNDCI
jgi:hypothetical protein